jgi:general secretion pathway protein F
MRDSRLLRVLASTLERGAPADREVAVLAESAASRRDREGLTALARFLAEGAPLADALRRAGAVEDDADLAQLQAGATSGRLPLILRGMAERADHAQRIRREVIRVLLPIVACSFLFVLLLAGAAWFSATFAEVLHNIGVPLPVLTRGIFALGFFHPLLVAAVAALGLALPGLGAWALVTSTNAGRAELWIPVWGRVARARDLSSFCTSLGLLLEAGVPLAAAGEPAARGVRNGWFREGFVRFRERATSGMSASKALEAVDGVPQVMQWAVVLGEQRGDLPAMLLHLGELYGREAEGAATVLSHLIPVLGTIVMIHLVGGTLLVAMLPLFSVLQELR